MTTNQVMNFWLMQAEQKKRIVHEIKKIFIPSIYKELEEEVDAICDEADREST